MFNLASGQPCFGLALFGFMAFVMLAVILRATSRKKTRNEGPWCVVDNFRGQGSTRKLPEETWATWVCGSPDCHTKNPSHAQYCRQCGRPVATGDLDE